MYLLLFLKVLLLFQIHVMYVCMYVCMYVSGSSSLAGPKRKAAPSVCTSPEIPSAPSQEVLRGGAIPVLCFLDLKIMVRVQGTQARRRIPTICTVPERSHGQGFPRKNEVLSAHNAPVGCSGL